MLKVGNVVRIIIDTKRIQNIDDTNHRARNILHFILNISIYKVGCWFSQISFYIICIQQLNQKELKEFNTSFHTQCIYKIHNFHRTQQIYCNTFVSTAFLYILLQYISTFIRNFPLGYITRQMFLFSPILNNILRIRKVRTSIWHEESRFGIRKLVFFVT
jgi:hypothetical protein